MKKILVLLGICLVLSPLQLFAGGNRDKCELTIENKTGRRITQIIIDASESNRKPEELNRNIENNSSTVIQIKKGTQYGIILVDTDGRQYAKRRQVWNEDTASIDFVYRDIQDRDIWDKILRILTWPFNL